MTGDMPAISASSYGSSTYALGNLSAGIGVLNQRAFSGVAQGGDETALLTATAIIKRQPKESPTVTRRLVQVFIADPSENVPLDMALLYSGDQKFTDATDQELFFEIDMKDILQRHNEQRAKIVNKKVKDRVEHLEPIKIRDLKMVVVNVATF